MVKTERGPTVLSSGGSVSAFAARRSAWACGSADVIIAAFDGRVRLQLAGLLERL
ncbi:hypothetical protein [Streptomyces niveus]